MSSFLLLWICLYIKKADKPYFYACYTKPEIAHEIFEAVPQNSLPILCIPHIYIYVDEVLQL